MVDLFRYRHWDLVSRRWIYYVISIVILGIGMTAWFVHGLNKGIDFTGGGLINYQLDKHLTAGDDARFIGELREKLDKSIGSSEVQISPSATDAKGDVVIVRTKLPTVEKQEEALDKQINDAITPALQEVASEHGAKIVPSREQQMYDSKEVVTGTISDQLKTQAIGAVVIGSILIMLWIWVRYNIGGLGLRYSVASIIALAHDLLTLVGLTALFKVQINSPFIAALLTVLGFSIHDTIVIFDRIRENIRLRKGRTFAETVNISLLETLARSVNTVLTVLLTLLALFFFGGQTLKDFVVAMLIGVTVGAYSSIFVASQLLVSWSPAKEKVLLPYAPPAEPVATPAQRVAVATPVSAPEPALATAPSAKPVVASKEAIQRAKQAGKTSKRKR